MILQLGWFHALNDISHDFNFLSGQCFQEMSTSDLKKNAADLALKYNDDLDAYEFANEIERFKFQANTLFNKLNEMGPLDILQNIHHLSLQNIYSNIDTALRIYITLPVTTATC